MSESKTIPFSVQDEKFFIETIANIKNPSMDYGDLNDLFVEHNLSDCLEFPYEDRDEFRFLLGDSSTFSFLSLLKEKGVVTDEQELEILSSDATSIVFFYTYD